MELKTLLALCLTSRGETYHHWKVFTDKSNGVCIHFRRDEFKQAMRVAGVKVEKVEYLKLEQFVAEDHPIETLPCLQRSRSLATGLLSSRRFKRLLLASADPRCAWPE